MTRLALVIAAAIVSLAPTVGRASDNSRVMRAALRAKPGTALIGGIVTSQDETARPLRRVLVTLSGSAVTGSVQVTTDDSGRFAFPDLPAGRTRSRPRSPRT